MKNTSKEKWGFDSNIIIYLFDKKSPYHQLAISAFQKTSEPVLTQQNIVETTKILTSFYKLSLKQSVKQIQSVISSDDLLLIHPSSQTISIYLKLCGQANRKSKSHFDLYLAATLLSNNIHTLITNNPKDFQNIPNLKIIPLKTFSL